MDLTRRNRLPSGQLGSLYCILLSSRGLYGGTCYPPVNVGLVPSYCTESLPNSAWGLGGETHRYPSNIVGLLRYGRSQASVTAELSVFRVLSIHTITDFEVIKPQSEGLNLRTTWDLCTQGTITCGMVPMAQLRGVIILSQRTDTVSDHVLSYYCLLWHSRPSDRYYPFNIQTTQS